VQSFAAARRHDAALDDTLKPLCKPEVIGSIPIRSIADLQGLLQRAVARAAESQAFAGVPSQSQDAGGRSADGFTVLRRRYAERARKPRGLNGFREIARGSVSHNATHAQRPVLIVPRSS